MQRRSPKIIKKQEELMKKTVKNQDVVITTALIPGKKSTINH